MGDDKSSILSYYCTEEYLDKFLGEFQIKDRPKRMVYRFMNQEKKMDTLPTKPSSLVYSNANNTTYVNSYINSNTDTLRYPSRTPYQVAGKQISYEC